jgi:hypothetical protein
MKRGSGISLPGEDRLIWMRIYTISGGLIRMIATWLTYFKVGWRSCLSIYRINFGTAMVALVAADCGRLWVPDDIPVPKIEWDDTSPIASYAERAGGIVFHAKDLPSVKRMIRGRVTDLNMKPVSI